MGRPTFTLVLAVVACFSAMRETTAVAQARDCEATRQAWELDPHMPKGCTCLRSDSTPQCNSFNNGTFFGTSRSFAAGMAGSLISGLLASAFAPIETDTSAIDAQRAAAAAAQKQLEALNRKFLAEWQAFQEHAARARAVDRTRSEAEGQELLDRLHGTGPTPRATPPAPAPRPTPIGGLDGFKWETPPGDRPRLAPLSQATFDTSGLQDWQRALCAAYFSQMALATVDEDPSRARDLDEQAERAMRGQPVAVACSFPELRPIPGPGSPEPSAEETGPSLAASTRALELVRSRAAQLQEIEARLRDLRAERSRAEEARRLAVAQRDRDEADRALDSVTQAITDIEMRKESIRRELEAVQRQLQAASAG